jgi:hypothetical protein
MSKRPDAIACLSTNFCLHINHPIKSVYKVWLFYFRISVFNNLCLPVKRFRLGRGETAPPPSWRISPAPSPTQFRDLWACLFISLNGLQQKRLKVQCIMMLISVEYLVSKTKSHCKTRLAVFPFAAGMSITKLAGRESLNYSRQERVW